MSGSPPILPLIQFSNAAGAPLANGTVTTYVAGSLTLAPTYQDIDLATLNTNPIELDSSGQATIYLDPAIAYKFELKNAAGATVAGWPVDNIRGALSNIDVSVKDFGAVGDGVTDDSDAINAAITHAKTYGLRLNAPAGTYKCRNLRLEGGTLPWSLHGAGKDLTIFEHSDGDGTLMTGNAGSSVPYNLADFTVDCQYAETAHASANNAISFADTEGVLLERIRVQNYKGDGILGYATVANTFGNCIGIDCEAIGNGATTENGLLFADMPGCKWIRSKGYNLLGSPGYAVQLKNDCRDGQMIECIGDTCNGAVIFGNDGAPRGVSRSTVLAARAYNCGAAFIADDSNTNSVHFAHIDMNAIVNHAVRMQTASVGNDVKVDVIEGIGAARSAVLFQTGSTDNVVEIGTIANVDAASSCVTFDSGADRNTVTVGRKIVPAASLASEAVFTGSETGNRFTLEQEPVYGVQRIIASGVITIPNAAQSLVILETEASAASDDLDTITAAPTDGRRVTLRTTNDARDVVVTNSGNIALVGGASFTLSSRRCNLVLEYHASNVKWLEVSRAVHA